MSKKNVKMAIVQAQDSDTDLMLERSIGIRLDKSRMHVENITGMLEGVLALVGLSRGEFNAGVGVTDNDAFAISMVVDSARERLDEVLEHLEKAISITMRHVPRCTNPTVEIVANLMGKLDSSDQAAVVDIIQERFRNKLIEGRERQARLA